ncbi:MAG TPA: cation:proton antiporter [Streptosporangiaceae bacterium]
MTDTDVQLLLADLAIIIVLARLLGAAAKRIGQPPVLGEIVAGILLGPTIWGTAITGTLFPPTLIPPLTALADLGLVLFMFVVGYEVDLGLVRGRERVAASVALGSIVVPLALGCGLGAWLAHRYHAHNTTVFVLFFGTAMSITAFPVLARILTDRGLHRTRVGGMALAAASVDDVLAWALLAVVIAVAGAGSGHGQLRLALAPVYAAVMIWLVRPGLRWLARVFERQGRLTPNVLAAVLALLLASSYLTDWMGVKFIFGAFIFGIVMPRDVPALREAILDRLEQISVIVLLPVFFVVAGLNVNLRGIGLAGLIDLVLIMIVAVAGKFGGAYFGARATGVRTRQAGAIAALMNTRGLTEIVILTVGLQLGILSPSLFTLMVVMAILTTGMTGPLLKVIYPNRIMERDIAEADRAALGRPAAHRILVLIDDVAAAAPLADLGGRLAASRPHSELVLSHLVPHAPAVRLEVGSGLGGELLQMTRTMSALHELAGRAPAGVTAVVQSRFSDNVRAEQSGFVAAAAPDTIVLAGPPPGNGGELTADRRPDFGADGTVQLVYLLRPLPGHPSAAVAQWSRSADGDAALQVAAQLAVAGGNDLVITPPGRAGGSLAADLTRRGVTARAAEQPAGAVVVAPMSALAKAATALAATGAQPAGGRPSGPAAAHLGVVAGTREASDDMDHWVPALAGQATPAGSSVPGSDRSNPTDSHRTDSAPGSGPKESRQP